jgi:hypothetical protein
MITILWRPARFVLDAVLVVLGLAFGVVAAAGVWRHCATLSQFEFGWMLRAVSYELLAILTAVCLYLGWSVVLVLFCGRDFIQGRRRKLKAPR